MPPKKKAGDGDVSFEISGSAPASQTSIVVDDAWPSQKNRSRELKWTKKPKTTPDKIKDKAHEVFIACVVAKLAFDTVRWLLERRKKRRRGGAAPAA